VTEARPEGEGGCEASSPPESMDWSEERDVLAPPTAPPPREDEERSATSAEECSPWEKRSPRPHRPLAALAAAAARRGTPSFGPTGRRRKSGVAPGVEQGVLRGVLRREERLLERSRRKRALFFE